MLQRPRRWLLLLARLSHRTGKQFMPLADWIGIPKCHHWPLILFYRLALALGITVLAHRRIRRSERRYRQGIETWQVQGC